MSVYKVEKYNAKTGEYKVCKENLPSSLDFWERSKRDSRKDNNFVNFIFVPTKKGAGYKVTCITVNFFDKDIWIYTLLKS